MAPFQSIKASVYHTTFAVELFGASRFQISSCPYVRGATDMIIIEYITSKVHPDVQHPILIDLRCHEKLPPTDDPESPENMAPKLLEEIKIKNEATLQSLHCHGNIDR